MFTNATNTLAITIILTFTMVTIITIIRCTSEKGRKVGSQKPPGWSEGTLYKCPFCLITYFRWFSSLILILIFYLVLDPDPDKRPYPPHQYRHQCQDPCNWDDFNDLILHLYSSSFRYCTFRIHLGITHQIKDSEEKKAFIEVNEFLTDIYTCKVG